MRPFVRSRRRGVGRQRLATLWMTGSILAGLLAQASPAWALNAEPAPADPGANPPTILTPGPAVSEAGAVPIDPGTAGGTGKAQLTAGTGAQLRTVKPAAAAPKVATEDVTKRSEHSRTIALPDGSFQLQVSQGRLNYQDDQGAWQPVDLGLRLTEDPTYNLDVRALDRQVSLSSGAGTGLGRVAMTGVGSIALSAPNGRGTGRLADGQVSFDGARANDPALRVQPTDTGLEFAGTWTSAAQANSIELHLAVDGLLPVVAKDGQTIELFAFVDNGDYVDTQLVGQISAPLLLEGGDQGRPVLDPGLITVSITPDGVRGWLLRYAINAGWLADSSRIFPVVLDPTVCIGAGASGCDHTYNGSENIDTFILSAQPNYWPTGWTAIRAGYDASGFGYGVQRSLLYFPTIARDGVNLPEGAMVSSADLQLRMSQLFGNASGKSVDVMPVTAPWNHTTATWNNTGGGGTFNSTYVATTTVPASAGYMHWTLTDAIWRQYTENRDDYIRNYGFIVKFQNEASNAGSVNFNRYNDATSAYRPLLTFTYRVLQSKLAFDPALGPNYSPSTMLANTITSLPVKITNTSGATFVSYSTNNASHDDIGYRWFDMDGKVVSTGRTYLGSDLANGDTTDTISMRISTPTAPGQYTLRVEMLHEEGSNDTWSSDFADPSLFFARVKASFAPQNTRWTGNSVIERNDFGISVVTAAAGGGEWRNVTLGDGSTVAINLWNKDLTYTGDEGVGFSDLLTVGLSYTYHAGTIGNAGGILGAYGWSTNFDESIIPSGTKGNYTYQDPSGNQSTLSTTPDGQIVGAGVLVNRPRVTIYDEWGSVPNGTYVDPRPTFTAFAGTYGLRVASGSSLGVTPADFVPLDLSAYPIVNIAVRTDNAASTAMAFKVKNVTDTSKNVDTDGTWFAYTFGTAFSTGVSQYDLGGSIAGAWVKPSDNLLARIVAAGTFGSISDRYQVTQFQTITGGGTGYTWFDAFRFEGDFVTAYDEGEPSWTGNGGNAAEQPGDTPSGTGNALLVSPVGFASAAYCTTDTACFTIRELAKYPWVSWKWKKAGGSTVAIAFSVYNATQGVADAITYYAGPTAPVGVNHVIQVSETAPENWTTVNINLLEDARTGLGWFDADAGDTTAETASALGKAKPAWALAGATSGTAAGPDRIQAIGYTVAGIDGGGMLIDELQYASLPDLGRPAYSHPNATDDAFPNDKVYEFSAAYPDGTIHYFNAAGRLMAIADRNDVLNGANENRVKLSYELAINTAGAGAYHLTTVAGPSDGVTGGGSYWQRNLAVTITGSYPHPSSVTFTEKLGTTGTSITGRSTTFSMDGSYDVTTIKPARQPSCAVSAPTGCTTLAYSSHRLTTIQDPRFNANNYTYTIHYDGSNYPDYVRDDTVAAGAGLMLRVLNWDVTPVGTLAPASTRVLWQDAAGIRAGAATFTDLLSNGSLLYESTPMACGGGNCTGNPPSTTNLTTEHVREARQYDGISRVSTVITYRCPASTTDRLGCTGSTGEPVITRRAQRTAAYIDNYSDPLTGGELAWTQTADEYAASFAATGGTNVDLYRTTYRYDEFGRPTAVTKPVLNTHPDYSGVARTTTTPAGFWRLGEASGNFADSSGNNRLATAVSFTAGQYAQAGAIAAATDGAARFDGSALATASLSLNQSAYSVAAWVKLEAAPINNGRGVLGNWTGGTGGIVLYVGNTGHWSLYHNGPLADSGIVPQEDRWYYLVGTWDGSTARIYVDGVLAGSVATAAAPAGASSMEIGDYASYAGFSDTYFNGLIDEASVWNVALTADQIAAQYAARGSAVYVTTHTTYDRAWRPTSIDDQFLVSPGFESGQGTWSFANGAGTCTSSCMHAGNVALATGTNAAATASQIVNLVAGQTFRYQTWVRSTNAAAQAKIDFEYWKPSAGNGVGAWTSILSSSFAPGTTYVSKAWDITLPFDTDGRVRVTLGRANGSNDVYYDDNALLTTWANTTYNANGTPDLSQVLKPGTSGGASATISLKNQYAASGTIHPAIWPTTGIANYVDGNYSSATPDEDVISTQTYDSWGRKITSTDPDGVSSTTTYSSSGTYGDKTDPVTVTDGLGNVTTRTYDRVGNVLTVVTPNSETTTSVYNLRSQVTSVTAPNGTISTSTYDAQGFKTADTANYVDGTPSTGIDDVITRYGYDAAGNLTQTDADCGDKDLTDPCNVAGYVDARTITTYDLLHNPITTTVYPGAGATGTTRVTTSYVEVATDYLGTTYVARPRPSAVRAPVLPTGAPSPKCPDATITTTYCTSAALTNFGTSGLDLAGNAYSSVNANGIITRTFSDLAGRPVFVVTNYEDGVYTTNQAADKDLISTTVYDLAGQPIKTYDTMGRSQATTRDNLERVTAVTSYDTTPTAISVTKTVYTPGGRVDRVSAPDGTGVADASRSWTKTVYDDAGRAIRTIARYDTAGAAGMVVDSFEGTPLTEKTIANDSINQSWSTAAGTFVGAGASATEIHDGSVTAKSGVSVLSVTSGGNTTGIEWKLDGTFKNGRTYKATIWLNAPSGKNVTVKLGNGSQSVNSVHTGTGAWARVTVTFSPNADRNSVVLAVYRSTSTGSAYSWTMDDAIVWDNGTPDLNVPTSETVNDANGAIIRTVLPPGDPGTDEPLVTTTARDTLGRPTTVTVNAIAGAGTGDTTSNLASVTHYDALGRIDYTLDQVGSKTSFAFDRLGRAIQTIQNDTGSTPANAKADNDVKSTFGYNALGQLTAYCPAMQVTLFVAGTPCSPTATTGEAYQRGWHWTYDDAGHQASEIAPVNQTSTALDTTTWAYNAAGQLTTQVSQSTGGTVHRHTDLTYDNAGRVTQSIVYQNSGTGTPKIRTTTSYFGDGAQDAIAVYLNGSGSASDAVNFTYDTAGRPDQVKRSATVLTDFAWNADGTLASRADGDAGAVGTTSFTYDWAKRIAGATLPSGWQSGGGTASFTYRPDGLLATRKFNSDANAVTYAYDAAKRPTSLSKTLTGGSLTLTQAWDRVGNITSEGRTITPAGPTGDAATSTQSFTYDDLNRLEGSTGLAAGTRAYEWDLNSNRVSKTEGADSYVSIYDRTDALVSVNKNSAGAVVSGYDTYGNLTTNPETGTNAGIVTLAYDLADRTVSITPTGGTASTLVLDALGRVRTRTTGSSVDTYSYAGATNNVVRIANAGGSGTTTDSVLDPSGLRFGTKTGATVAWLLADLHGSVAVGLNQAGTTVTDALRYDGAGMTVATYPGGGSAATKSWKYQGRLDVAASGPSLHDFEAREMSPGLGSFTSNDTVLGSATNPAQLNRYVYAKANPRSFIDPDGHCSFALDADDPCEGTAGWSFVSYDEFMDQQANIARGEDGRNGYLASTPVSVKKDCGFLAWDCVSSLVKGFGGAVIDSAMAASQTWQCTQNILCSGAVVQSVWDTMSSVGSFVNSAVDDPIGALVDASLTGAGAFDAAKAAVGDEWDRLTSSDMPSAAEAWGRVGGTVASIVAPAFLTGGTSMAAEGFATVGAATATGARGAAVIKVAYGSTDLSRAAIAARQAAGVTGLRNTAVVEVLTDSGYSTRTAFSQMNVGHAERLLDKALQADGINASQVTRFYSELEPCGMPGGYCGAMIARRYPQAEASYSFEYGATKASREAGKAALRAALAGIFGK